MRARHREHGVRADAGPGAADRHGRDHYLGFVGGLYENGTNEPPPDHGAVGLARARMLKPLDTNGVASATGKIVLVSLGMSNTTQEFCSAGGLAPCSAWTFVGQAQGDPAVNHATLVLVNGARGGQTAPTWDSPSDSNYNRIRDVDLANVGLTEAQVQIAWVKVANAGPTSSLPAANADAYTLETQLGNIVRALKVRYPNLKLVFISSRIYAGYATTALNPEPYAYQYGFSVKWIVQAQIDQMRNNGTIVDARGGDLNYNMGAPWIGWGAYLWANGPMPRLDGLTWAPGEFQSDGTHPSQSGEQKVGSLLLDFFKHDPLALTWFLAPMNVAPDSGPATGGTSVTLNWTNFQAGATVTIGGVAASVGSVSSTSLTATTSALSPGTLNDVVVTNPDGTTPTIPAGYLSDFLDVPGSHPFHDVVETVFRNRVTIGCGSGLFCVDAFTNRGQIAVFLVRAVSALGYVPPPATGAVFGDVPVTHPFAAWIEELARRGITSGCSTSPALYCPDALVNRTQLAILLLKAKLDTGYAPPAATGTLFADVPVTYPSADWIEDFYRRGITSGCATNPLRYCPAATASRGETAAFLARAFFPG